MPMRPHGFREQDDGRTGGYEMRTRSQFDSSGLSAVDTRRLSNPLGDGISNRGHSGLRWGQRPIAGRRHPQGGNPMTRSRTLIAAAAFAAIATSAFSQTPIE